MAKGTVTRLASAVLATSSLIGAASAAVLDLPVIIQSGYKMVEVGVGNPPQNYRLLFDTGSASTWMIDSECADTCSHIDKGSRTGYNISASSTGRLTGQDAEIGYIDGNRVAGPTVEELFSTDSLSFNASFIAANESNWSALPAHGFMGLAFGSIADGGAAPIFESLMAEKLMDEPKFGIYYARDEGYDTGGVAGKGLLTLGGSKEREYVDGDLATIQLTTGEVGYDVWRSVLHTTTGKRKARNGTEIKTQTDLSWTSAVFDTGASSISLPDDKIVEIYESIGMNWTAIIEGDHVPLCSEFTNDWSISFEVGFYGDTRTLTLTGDQLAIPGFANREDGCWPPFETSGSSGFALIGVRLLKHYYTVWDYGNFPKEGEFIDPTLSFGKLKTGY
ncbi:aspartic peptidase domain-containing protein [Fusarium venenatum]|uniref:aspartic peptidase domain-containing protein n=1 Tax=Fusarium venenatum TaxID=56646 RepID=UPI001E0D1ADD|nr:aspartic peptidase domain-containing protein [Fusarium venenatum]